MNDNVTPVFVKIEEYKEVLDIIDVVKEKIRNAETVVDELKQLKDDENKELASWTENLKDITQKVESIDKTIFGKR